MAANDAHKNFTPGWKPRVEDDRDWRVREILDGTILERVDGEELDRALASLVKSWNVPQSVKAWAKLVNQTLKDLATPAEPIPVPVPIPIPDPVVANVRWQTPIVLDQGNTPHCVGFTGADFLGDEPVMDPNVNAALGHALYYECKVIDGEAGAENGSDMRSLGKVLKNRGRIDGYAFASTVDEVRTWVRTRGPVMMGTEWYASMFYPDAKGVVKIAGAAEGGHAWSIVGHNSDTGLYTGKNHWGTGYGDGGFFYFGDEVLARLLREQGDALVAVELPKN